MASFIRNVSFDCSDPYALAQLWSAVIGHPVQKLVDYAKEQGIDLIVMATHGRSGIEHALLGGTTEKMVRNAPCSVHVIRRKQ